MRGFPLISLACISLCVLCHCKKGQHARGFNAAVDWKLFDKGIQIAENRSQVALVLIHKSWCGACKGLAASVERSKTFAELAEDFVMVNVQDNEEPADERWHPDKAAYVPRVLFYDGRTHQLLNITCENCNAPNEPYFYNHVNSLVASMKRAKKLAKKLLIEDQENSKDGAPDKPEL
eukprot:CAMPEP_0202823356 /NCGR_PEP_ID=MMETSP1389-20130828/11668_1 /ASSEMBLY_ACC=CAM_ASM_000865 /TAXON_ID=302021 /ORGANISM="Rhodomonas sp., Strain CCMP768" /LENGTH=176 /DNA_ID=CAMNT_0049496349 /DNA_START=11 /DNA_END=541 /DNA_ORIENTATION=+